jgi:single-strand DNA-binding protein
MNLVILVGRITADVDIKMTTSGKKVCSFTLAVDDGKNADGSRRTEFPDCEAWEKAAEFLERYVHKGNRIAVVGKLTKKTYEVDGQKRYSTKVNVSRVEFADGANQPKNEYSSAPVQTAPQTAQNQPVQTSMDNGFGIPTSYGIDSDDLPF